MTLSGNSSASYQARINGAGAPVAEFSEQVFRYKRGVADGLYPVVIIARKELGVHCAGDQRIEKAVAVAPSSL